MSGDDLAIELFFIGAAITFLVAGVAQAGWKRRAIIWGLFVIAGVMAIVGFGWPWIKDLSPGLTKKISELATNIVAQFVVVMFGVGAILFTKLGSKKSVNAAAQRVTDAMLDSPYPATANPNLTVIATQTSNLHIHISPNPSAAANQVFAVFQPDGTVLNSQNVPAITVNAANAGRDFTLRLATLMDPKTMKVVAMPPTPNSFRRMITASAVRIIFDREVSSIIAVKIEE